MVAKDITFIWVRFTRLMESAVSDTCNVRWELWPDSQTKCFSF